MNCQAENKEQLPGGRIQELRTGWAGQHFFYQENTDSTNADAIALAEQGAPHGTVAAADSQKAGRGRRGRSWQSPAGVAVYFTILLRPEFSPDKASMLTLVMALGVAEAVEEVTGLTAEIKWPNDIVLHGKKVCGILTEMSVKPGTGAIEYVVVGVGVNVNQMERGAFSPEIRECATSLGLEGGCVYSRKELLKKILERFEEHYETFEKAMSLQPLKESYQSRLAGVDGTVRVLDPAGEYTGISRGINSAGELLVEREDGTYVRVYAGEVSVRGLYGYV